MPITLRQLHEHDWTALREVRLKALQTDPSVFSSNYKKEAEKTEADWRGWLTNPDGAIFGLFDANNMIGMTGIALDRNDLSRTSALLWGSWIAPEHRRKGFSKLYYEARLKWATQHPTCEKITVSVRESNIASRIASQRFGFAYTHQQEKTWPDSQKEDEIFYSLEVKPSTPPTPSSLSQPVA